MFYIATLHVSDIEAPVRLLDYCLGRFEALPTRNSLKKALKRGEIHHNHTPARQADWVQAGDTISLTEPMHKPPKAFPQPIDVHYEDAYLAVVFKPPGLPTNGNSFQTLENALVDQIPTSDQADALRWARPVHRLDTPTSGLLIVAKTATAHARLGQMFEQRQLKKRYEAIVVGHTPDSGSCSKPIDGLEAHTEYETLARVHSLRNVWLSHLSLRPLTGRRHQLRKHMAELSHPIMGDKAYGPEGDVMTHKGLFLSAVGLEFVHPITGQPVCVDVATPEKFVALMQREQRRWQRYNG